SKFNSRLAQSHVIMLAKPTMYRLGPSNERSHHVYQPIPGCAHLMRFIPDDPVVYSAPSNDMDEQQKLLTSKLVSIALEFASGFRSLALLPYKCFDTWIFTHISSWSRTHGSKNA